MPRFVVLEHHATHLYWRRIIPIGQTSSIAFPFSRLHNEPFWELLPLPGNEMIPAGQHGEGLRGRVRKITEYLQQCGTVGEINEIGRLPCLPTNNM